MSTLFNPDDYHVDRLPDSALGSLSPDQFSQRSDVMFHRTNAEEWDPQGDRPVHLGTEIAANEAPSGMAGSALLRFQLPEMLNTLDDPVSDFDANAIAGTPDAAVDTETDISGRSATYAEGADFNRGWGGLFYTNEAEDVGSVSAVVPTARSLTSWGQHVSERVRRGQERWPARAAEAAGEFNIIGRTDRPVFAMGGSRLPRAGLEPRDVIFNEATGVEDRKAWRERVTAPGIQQRMWDRSAHDAYESAS